MELHLNSLKGFENRFDSKIKDAKIYPTWVLVVLVVSVLFGIGATALFLS